MTDANDLNVAVARYYARTFFDEGKMAGAERSPSGVDLTPLWYLRDVGIPEEIAAIIEALLSAVRFLPRTFLADDYRQVEEALAIYGHHLDELHDQAVEARHWLEESGWQFDPKTRRARALGTAGLKGNRRKELVNREIERAYLFFSGGKRAGNTAAMRERISESLEWYFRKKEVSPEHRGPIWHVINNYRPPDK